MAKKYNAQDVKEELGENTPSGVAVELIPRSTMRTMLVMAVAVIAFMTFVVVASPSRTASNRAIIFDSLESTYGLTFEDETRQTALPKSHTDSIVANDVEMTDGSETLDEVHIKRVSAEKFALYAPASQGSERLVELEPAN